MTAVATRRRADARRLLAQADSDPSARQKLDALAPDQPHGAVLAERLRFGPPETWLGWRAGLGRVIVKLWPDGSRLTPLPRVAHPGVAPLVDQGAGWRMFAWVAGETLAAALRRGTAPLSAAGQVAEAVAALHAAGIAHGDLNPANIVVGAHGAVLIDWGEDDCAGTPGWRPEGPHDRFLRDHHALERLRALICGPPADGTP
ncbi:MAG: lipopolysaccharide kinase InaA family protein [Bacteroidales bacterium]